MRRYGKKVQLVEASLYADDLEVVRASALRLRVADLHIPDGLTPEYAVPPAGELVPREMSLEERPWGFGDAIDFGAVAGWPMQLGPGVVWVRLNVPTVAGDGDANSPRMQVAAAADFGNGISSPLGWDQGWTFINPTSPSTFTGFPRVSGSGST